MYYIYKYPPQTWYRSSPGQTDPARKEGFMLTADTDLLPSIALEVERMRLQAEAWEPEVELWLDQVGVQPGWRCVDLGCGPVGILGPLDRRVERKGRVVGVDNDPKKLEAARQYVQDNRLESVEIVPSDVFDTVLECETFDLTHSRFMIAPHGRHEDLLSEMISLTRPGGIVAVEEPDVSAWNCFPTRPAFRRLVSAFQDAFSESGGNLTAGRNTYTLLRRAGLEDVRARAVAVAGEAGHPFRKIILHFADALRKHIIEGDILSQPELDRCVAEVEQVVADPDVLVVSYLTTQVWGRKKKA